MIVKICDSCQKLLIPEQADCKWVAIREKGAVMFKRWRDGMAERANVSHFCSDDCTAEFIGQWMRGELTEPVVQDSPAVQSSPVPQMREPTAQEMAEQNSLLASLGIR